MPEVHVVYIWLRMIMHADQWRRKSLGTGGAIQLIRTHLYGEKLLFCGRTVKLGGASAP